MKNQPQTVICTYRVKAADQDAFVAILRDHWSVLREAGLATDKPVQHFLGDDGGKGPVFVEIFEWTSDEAPKIAHNTPEVMRVWEGMGQFVEARDGKPAMEFPHFQPFSPGEPSRVSGS